MRFSSVLLVLMTFSCSGSGPSPSSSVFAEEELAATSDVDGTATFSAAPSADKTTVLKPSSGAIAGASISLPPGSLSVATDITISVGDDLATEDNATAAGTSSAESAGPTVAIVSTQPIKVSSAAPLAISLPLSGGGLWLADKHVTVFFSVESKSGAKAAGAFATELVTIKDGKASIQLVTDVEIVKASFQPAYVSAPVTATVSKVVQPESTSGSETGTAETPGTLQLVSVCPSVGSVLAQGEKIKLQFSESVDLNDDGVETTFGASPSNTIDPTIEFRTATYLNDTFLLYQEPKWVGGDTITYTFKGLRSTSGKVFSGLFTWTVSTNISATGSGCTYP